MESIFKRYWYVISAVITAAFIIGIYYMKIEYMSEKIAANSLSIEKLNKTVYVLIGTLQNEYPQVDIRAYIDTSIQQNSSPEITTKGLTILKSSTKHNAELFLMREQGFTSEQAASVFKTSKPPQDDN